MKKTISFLTAILFSLALVQAAPDQNKVEQMTLGITSIAGVTTNTTTAISSNTTFQTGPSACRIYLTAQAVTGSTNAAGLITVTFQTSPDGTTFDSSTINSSSVTNSNIVLDMTLMSTNAQTVSDWFNVSGVRAIRVGRVQNLFPYAVTNMVIKIGYPTQ